ncbi:MAG: SH3 domain-containing protein [Rhodospirillales bacterium]
MRRPGWRCRPFVAALICFAFWPGETLAEDNTYRGIALQPLSGRYLVVKDVNVRAAPKTKSERVGSLKAGDWVEAMGRPKDASWIAVKKDGKPLGFVFAPVLVPMIDGTLSEPIRGSLNIKGGKRCDYEIRYTGKSPVEGEVFKTADYDVRFLCRLKGKTIKFLAPMFITEGPYQTARKPHYQINVDLLQVDTKQYDEIFSAVFIYQQDKSRLVFDGLTLKNLGIAPSQKEKPAKTVGEALQAAVTIAAGTWGPKVWEALLSNVKEPKKQD